MRKKILRAKIGYIILLLLTIIMLCSCNQNSVSISQEEYYKLKGFKTPDYPQELIINHVCGNIFSKNSTTKAYLLSIDSCEYIFMERSGDGGPALTHKGNCKFCIKRNIIKYEKIIIDTINH